MRSPSLVASPAWLVVISLCGCDADRSPAAPAPSAPSAASVSAPAPAASTAGASSAAPVVSAPPSEHDVAGVAQILVAYTGAELAPPAVARSRDEAQRRAQEALAKIQKEGVPFDEAARRYSDDEASRKVGGALGNVERGAMQAPFAASAFALPVGGVSDVVETKRGFYVIKRTR